MATVTFDSQSFMIDGRRIWLLGGSIHYARVPAEQWAGRIAAAKQAGFNTIQTACPWMIHEPRKGRYVFDGDANIHRFVELCAAAQMRVVLKAGPFIGDGYDGGGLPTWLLDTPNVALREANEPFLERVTQYFRRLMTEVADFQASRGGPIILVQSEHAWLCANPKQAEKYLREITRVLHENGVTVPIINANDLWQESVGTIDTWRGWDDLLASLRQLRTIQPDTPRIVSAFYPAEVATWGGEVSGEKSAGQVLQRLAQILAAGAQPIVAPLHGGTNFGFLGGRLAGRPDAFVTHSAAAGAPLGEAGTRGPKYAAIKRLMCFANSFSHVLADLEPDYQPAAIDVELPAKAGALSIVPLRGRQGRIIFAFGSMAGGASSAGSAMLLLDSGVRMPIELGDQPVGWYVLDVDLHGSGRLDYANLCPFAIVDRSILVLQGPAGSRALLVINGSPLEAQVPAVSAAKPTIIEHRNLTIVLCNRTQIDATYVDDKQVYVGVSGFDAKGLPAPHPDFAKGWVISAGAKMQAIAFERGASASKKAAAPTAITPQQWKAASMRSYSTGQSPRFATLDGPQPLSANGAITGYGWYRVRLDSSAARARLAHAPQAADRMHLYVNGALKTIIGVGPAAEPGPFDLRLDKGENVLVALVDNFGSFCEGNELVDRKGWFGHLYEVKELKSVKPRRVEAEPVDPFALRRYIAYRTFGQLSDMNQLAWTFAHTRKNPILVDIAGAAPSGTLVLNDQGIAYHAGATGSTMTRLLLDPSSTPGFKRGKNVLRFAPDLGQPDALDQVAAATSVYECVEAITEDASWAFAKWEPPPATMYQPITRNETKSVSGAPCWWRATFEGGESDIPAWLDTAGLSKGQVFINGRNLGRYFSATRSGKRVGPQQRLYIPAPWLKREGNELIIFDEHGCDPFKARIVFSASGDLD